MSAGKRLSEAEKLFIVQRLASFDSPTDVADAFREAFGKAIDRRRVQDYDPTKASGRDVSQKHRAVFEAARAAALADLSTIPIAHQAVRLRALNRMLVTAEAQGNIAFVLKLLKQAAIEVGGMYTNRRELTGAKGGPLQQAMSVLGMTDEAVTAIARQVVRE